MALLWCDGFDHYGTDTARMTEGPYDQVDAAFTLSAVNPRTGARCLRRDSSPSSGVLKKSFGDGKRTVGFGFSIFLDSLPNSDISYEICRLTDSEGSTQVSIGLSSSGGVSVSLLGFFGQLIGVSEENVLLPGQYNHLEAAFYASKSDLPLASNNICFVLDASGSMSTIVSDGSSRWDIQSSEVIDSLSALKSLIGTQLFIGVVVYNTGAWSLFREVLDSADIDDLIDFIGTFSPANETQWDAGMQGAADFFSFSNQVNPIIIFTSDGEPNDPGGANDDAEKQSITDDAIAIRDTIAGVSLYFIQIDLESTTYSSQLDNTGGVGIISSASGQMSNLVFSIIGLNSANPASGICEVRVNGVTEISESGIETVATENEEYSRLLVTLGSDRDHGVTTDIDDFYIWDDIGAWNNSFLGDKRALLKPPNADTNISDFEPSSGDFGYQMVDEDSPDEDATFILAESALLPGSPTSGSSEFEIQNLPSGVSQIAGVSVFTRAAKTDSGDAEIFTSIISGVNSVSGSPHELAEAYNYHIDLYEYDPATIANFTKDGFDLSLVSVNVELAPDLGSPGGSPDLGSPGGSPVGSPGVEIPQDSMVFYTMDNISGTTLVDEQGNQDGTINGANAVSGYIGNALDFDGTNDYVDAGSPFDFSGSVDFAFSLWIEPDNTGSNNFIFGTNVSTGLYARVNSNGTILVKLDDGINDAFASGTTNVVGSGFHHIVLMNESNTLTGWVDGVKEIEVSGHSVGGMDDTLRIGSVLGGTVVFFNGRTDHYRFYDRALTESEITLLANET